MQTSSDDLKCFALNGLFYDNYEVVLKTLDSLLNAYTTTLPATWRKLEELLITSGNLAHQNGSLRLTLFKKQDGQRDKILIKPNMVRDVTDLPDKSPEHIVTNWSLVIPVLYYSILTVGKKGEVVIADAPNSDSCMYNLQKRVCWDSVEKICKKAGYMVSFIDLRKEQYFTSNGVTTKREKLPGDPEGYTVVNIGKYSEFEDPSIDYSLLRGASHDDADTRKHHSQGRHEYLLSTSVLKANLVINMPKFKSHGKIGITGAVKNLVGINGDKNWLPHWRAGFRENGGDQYSRRSFTNTLRYYITSFSWPLLKYRAPAKIFALASKVAHSLGIRKIAGSGVGYQNDTTWRMVLDINKALLYSNLNGFICDDKEQTRSVLHIMDAITVGEGEGPLSVDPLYLGCILVSTDPVRIDILASRLCGLNWERFSYLTHITSSSKLKITDYKRENAYVSLNNIKYHMDDINQLVNMRLPSSWQNQVVK